MKKEKYTDFVICLNNSDNIIKEYSNYAEMIIHLFQLHTENPKADYFIKWYKYERTSYTEEDARKGGYCVMGEEDAWYADPRKPNPALGEDYPYLEDECKQIAKGTYELDILGKYQNKFAKHFMVG
jgi:hypothetical protein